MTVIGRGASAILVLAIVTLVVSVVIRPDLGTHSGPVHVLDWVGLMIYLSAPVTWISAIVHWALRFPREGPRTLWGVVAVVGFVPGAVAYWVWGFKHAVDPPTGQGE